MRQRRAVLLGLLGGLLLALYSGVALAQGGGTATAELEDTDGNPVGEATFTEGPGGVTLNVNVQQGVEPGEHGIHIHETGEVTPDFEAAGGHFNPTDNNHGFESPDGPHAGDLENITVNEDGTAAYTATTDRMTLSSGENGILDSDGSALIIHAQPDDYQTDPSGESGDRVAAGVIRGSGSDEPLTKTGGASPLSVAALTTISLALLIGAGVLIRQSRRA